MSSIHDDLTPLALEGLLTQLGVVALRQQRERVHAERLAPVWLERIRDRLRDDLQHAPSLKELAAEAGVHPSHVLRCFRRHYGRAPAAYLLRMRIDEARRALTTTDSPITEIALRVGFFDQAHFTRRFRAVTGTTPGRYRASVRS